VSLIESNDYVVLNNSVPTHFTLVGPNVWNILDLTVVSSSIASHCSVSINNEFLGSDHAIIHVAVHGVVTGQHGASSEMEFFTSKLD